MVARVLLLFCLLVALCFGRRGGGGHHGGKGGHHGSGGEKLHWFGGKCRGCCTVWPGPQLGKKCLFPFTWKGKTYEGCAYEPSQGDRHPWCSTKVDANGNHVAGQRQWGKCSRECSQTTPKPPGPCKCPKPGVEDGYMEYSQVKENFQQLWVNNTNLAEEVKENTVDLTNKCPKETCEEIQANSQRIEETLEKIRTQNMTALEEKVATLMEEMANLKSKVAENEAALDNKCNATDCAAIGSQVNKIENCLGDVGSSDCPTTAGKTGMATTIEANKAALEHKCDAQNCTNINNKIRNVETCFADKSSVSCRATEAGKVSITDAITALESPSVFNCMFTNGDVDVTTAILAPYTCDVNDDNVVDPATGKFTVKKAGKYRLTFMTLNFALNKKKVISSLVKTSSEAESKIARSVAQSMIGDEQEQVTTTIDIIHTLQVADTIHVSIQVKSGSKITGQSDPTKPQQVTFTGQYIRE